MVFMLIHIDTLFFKTQLHNIPLYGIILISHLLVDLHFSYYK